MRTNSRKFVLVLTALTLAFLISLGVGSASPGDWYVDDDCSPPTDGTAGDPFCTIAEGVNAASNGDTIYVAAGTYTENNIFVADKRISVVGAGSDATHLDIGSGYGFKITAGGSTPSPGCIHVSGFDVYGAGRGSGYALFFETGAGGTSEADKCTWENNKIHDMNYGVKTNDRDPRPQYWAFRNNEFYEIRVALLLEGTYHVDIMGNSFKDYKEGVEMNYGDGSARHWLVMNNEFSEGKDYCPDCKAGVILSANARDIVISGNVIMDSPAGILVPNNATVIDLTNVGINENCIMGNDVGLDDLETSSHVLDALNNYWGCADGPGNLGCDTVSGFVDYDPWATEPIQGVCAPANTAPVADPNGPYLGAVNTPIAFDGTGSSDPDNDPLTYDWDFGDSHTGTGDTPTHSYALAGIYDVCLTVNDGTVDSDPVCTIAVVYDPAGGFVTGGGWIDSPMNADYQYMQVGGKANFGFVSKYKKGATVPEGNTEFVLHAGGLNFHSSSYDWLVVNQGGTRAQFKGWGTINGGGDYRFMLWAGDGEPDTFRIKIWSEDGNGEDVVYDNGYEGSGYENGQPISGGSIVIHTKKK